MIATADAEQTTGAGERRPRAARGFLSRRDPAAWLVGLLSLLLGACFIAVDLAYNNGTIIAPIDDAYIHLQYASQLGAGHPFQYNTGDGISTGASSLLYVFVLALGYLIGFHGTWLLVFSVVFGVICMAVTTGLTYHLGRVLVNRTVGCWAGVLVAVSGPLLWGATSGMEVGMTALLAVATVLAFAREQPRYRWTPVLAFLLAIARPEGMILAVVLSVAMLCTLVPEVRHRELPRRDGLRRAAWCLLPFGAVVGQYLFFWIATGNLRANGVAAKSHLFDEPLFYAGRFLDRSVANLQQAAALFAGFTRQDFAFPAALLVAMLGGAYLLYARPRWRVLVIAVAAGLLGISVSVSTLDSALYHEMRYWQPFLPLFLLLAVCGLLGMARLAPGPRARRAAMHVLLVIALLFSLVELPTWAVRLGKQSATIRDTDVSVGAWISGSLPADATVAVKDVGAAKYFGDHRVVDLIGLTSNGFAAAGNNGIGALYEKLRHLPPGARPDFFAVYDKGPGPSMRPLRDTGVLGPPLTVFPVRAPAELSGFRIVPFDKLGVYPANWSLAGSGDAAPVPGTVRDYLNVGALTSERDHRYQPHMALPGLQPRSVLRRQGDVLDSGRTITGGEQFTVHHLRPGKPVHIAARFMVTGTQPSAITVRVNGHTVTTRPLGKSSDHWSVQTFTIPANLVTSPTLRIEVAPARPLLAPYPTYTSFGYWVLQ